MTILDSPTFFGLRMRNMLLALFLSAGTPMVTSGDEYLGTTRVCVCDRRFHRCCAVIPLAVFRNALFETLHISAFRACSSKRLRCEQNKSIWDIGECFHFVEILRYGRSQGDGFKTDSTCSNTNDEQPCDQLYLNITHKLQVTRLDLIYMDSEYRRNGYVQLWLELVLLCEEGTTTLGVKISWTGFPGQSAPRTEGEVSCSLCSLKIRGESNESSGPTKIADVDCNKVKHENHEIVDFYIYIYTIYIVWYMYIYYYIYHTIYIYYIYMSQYMSVNISFLLGPPWIFGQKKDPRSSRRMMA